MRRSRVGARCFPFVVVLTLVGCSGGARVDASRDDRAAATFQAIESGMTAAEKEQFLRDCETVAGSEFARAMGRQVPVEPAKPRKGAAKTKLAAAPKVSLAEAARPLHGLSAAEIADKARVIRAARELINRKVPR